MTSFETMTVWLFGIFCTAVTICSVVRSVTQTRAMPSSAESTAKAKRATREDVR